MKNKYINVFCCHIIHILCYCVILSINDFFSLYGAVLGNYSASSTFAHIFFFIVQKLFSYFQRAVLPSVPRACRRTFNIIKHYQTLSSNIPFFLDMRWKMMEMVLEWGELLKYSSVQFNFPCINFTGTKPNRITIKKIIWCEYIKNIKRLCFWLSWSLVVLL